MVPSKKKSDIKSRFKSRSDWLSHSKAASNALAYSIEIFDQISWVIEFIENRKCDVNNSIRNRIVDKQAFMFNCQLMYDSFEKNYFSNHWKSCSEMVEVLENSRNFAFSHCGNYCTQHLLFSEFYYRLNSENRD